MEKRIVRLCIKIQEQGGMFTEMDITILLGVTSYMISNHVRSYEKSIKRLF